MLARLLVLSVLACSVGCTGAVDEPSEPTTPDDAGADTKVGSDTGTVAPRDSAPEDSGRPIDDTGPTTAPDGWPTVAVAKLTGATGDEPKMVADGIALANATMRTACFRDHVLSAAWTETGGLTQAQIWEKLCKGTITVDVDLYTGSWYQNHVTHTVGYENEPGVVHMNRYYVNTAYMVADNVIHEAEGHSQGFTHYGVKATSVPYGLNGAFEDCSPEKP